MAKALDFLCQLKRLRAQPNWKSGGRLEIDFPQFIVNGSQDGFTICWMLYSFQRTKQLWFYLIWTGIAVSRGSACQSGSIRASHVLAEMLSDEDLRKPSLRISFSHYNSKEI
jgi:cysteine desulfurase